MCSFVIVVDEGLRVIDRPGEGNAEKVQQRDAYLPLAVGSEPGKIASCTPDISQQCLPSFNSAVATNRTSMLTTPMVKGVERS